MKRTLLFLSSIMIFLPLLLSAQQETAPSSQETLKSNLSMARIPTPMPTTNALFDLQFDYVLPKGGCAGITWTYNEFWVSKWASDTLFTVDKTTGAITSTFFITGVSGIRGMAFDGTGVWVANNTNSIYKVDTATKAVIDTINAPIAVRGIAYDSSANSGAGGFWIANFNTDINQIDFSGNILNAILAGTHGLTAMYGIAFDPWSTGGPYIWAFDQSTTGTAQNLVRINIASGIKDVVHDVGLQIGGAGNAGGIAITGFANPGPHTLLGLSQDSPDRVFGLELGDFVLPTYDASADTILFTPATTLTPSFLLGPINWTVAVTNQGANTINSINADLTVNDGVSNVFTSTGTIASVPSLVSTSLAIQNTYTPPATVAANYDVTTIINTGSQLDAVSSNDTLQYSFSVSDTVMSRGGAPVSSIGIGNGTGGSFGLNYDIPILCYATSATFYLRKPTMGDSIKAELFDWSGTSPNNLIATSAAYIITGPDTAGAIVTLPFLNAPFQLNPGTYTLCVHEHNANVSIRYSFFNWRPNTTWVYIAANGWRPSEQYSFPVVPLADLNVWSQAMVSIKDINSSSFNVFPNPSSSQFIIDFPVSGNYNLTVCDYLGKVVYQKAIQGNRREFVHTGDWSNGMYVAKIEADGRNYFSKVIIAH